MTFVQGLLIAIAGGLGAVLVRGIYDWLRNRRRDAATVTVARIRDEGDQRKELWAAIHSHTETIAKLQVDLDAWRMKYFELQKQYVELVATIHQNTETTAQVRIELDNWKERYTELQTQYDNLLARHNTLQQDYTRLEDEVTELRRASVGMRLKETEIGGVNP